MAKYYGESSKYLFWNEKIAAFFALIYLMFLVYIAYFVFIKHTLYLTSLSGILALIIVCGPTTLFCYLVYRYFNRRSDKFYYGRKGEDYVYYELRKLPNEFTIFEDVKIIGDGNIDFVILGPTGIFAIEVKSHSGNIEYNNGELLKNGAPFQEKNILNQVMGEALTLQNNLKSEVTFVYPVLVFSNKYVKMDFGFKPQDNVYVLKKPYLNNFIKSLPATLDETKLLKIENLLKLLLKKV